MAVAPAPGEVFRVLVRCPYCKANNDRVIDSRTSGEADAIRRRRECLECKGRFTTYEKVGETSLRVIKKDGSRVPFEREKILRSLQVACQKRPVGTAQIERVVTDIETRLHEMFDKEVASKYIGHLVMESLRDLDQVAYVRFASVWREFKDVNQFLDELKPLLAGTPVPAAVITPAGTAGEGGTSRATGRGVAIVSSADGSGATGADDGAAEP